MRSPKPQTTIKIFSDLIPGSERKRYAGSEDIEADFLVGEVDDTKGGTNYFSGNRTRRGYRISVQMRTKGESGNGIVFESFMLGGGICQSQWIEDATKFSAKRLQALSVEASILERLQNLKAECLAIYRATHQTEAVAV